jgi:hypothetical protein
VRLRVAELTDSERSGDHEATWLLGHTGRIDFSGLDLDGPYLVTRATLHVPCRFADPGPGSAIVCKAYGFRGQVPAPRRAVVDRKLGSDRFEIVENARLVDRTFAAPSPPRRLLPILATGAPANPCSVAPCRTADNTRGMACCRDLQVEIVCPRSNRRLEALVKSRKPPYLCKVERDSDDTLNVEMISACSFLATGIGCSLHGRKRPDGRSAKPDLCFDWPSEKDTRHPGCVF